MAEIDHFKVLGVKEDATSDDIKKAYFNLAKLHHPDASKSSHSMDKFRLICSSYEVLKNERTRADYLLEKNGHDWDKKGSNKFNDVRSDYAKAKREATKQSRRDIHSIMDTFERLIHPKNLFLLIPSAVLTYWMVMQLPPFFKKDNITDDGSVAGNIRAKAYKPPDTVDAWKNPKTNRWESPAPWDPNYRTYITTNALQKVERSQVSQAKQGEK